MAPTTERDQARRREEAEAAVGPLLARANLYRLRGQWNEAVSVCTEALRVAPQSPTAHSLLGDIYEAQGKLDDAIQWFSMAVDLNPGNLPDRTKLDRVLSAKRAIVTADEKTKTANGMAASPTLSGGQKEKTLDKTIEWFDRTFPPGRSDSIVRLILLVAVAIAGVIAVSVAFVYFIIIREKSAAFPAVNTPAAATAAAVTTGVVSPPPPVEPAMTVSAPIVVTPTPRPSPSPTPTAPPRSSSPAARDEIRVAAITRALSPGVIVHSAQPTDGVMQIALEFERQVLDEAPADTRERVLRVAAQAAHLAAGGNDKPQKTVVSVALVGGIPAFRGEISASAIPVGSDPALLPPVEIAALFSNIQWNSSLSVDKTAAVSP